MCRAGEDYYLATSTFEYFPGVPLYHSENLVDWEPIGHCLTREEQLPIADVASSEGVFAPTLREHDGTFYLVTTLVGAGVNLVVTADDPRGEWSDPTWIDAPGYDPDLFWDDGTTYLTYTNDDALHQTTVDLETVIEASREGDLDRAFRGFLLDPQVQSLGTEEARDLFAALVAAEREYLTEWELQEADVLAESSTY